MTLAGLKLVGANSMPHDYKQKYKKEGPSVKEVHEKTVLSLPSLKKK